MKTSCLSYLAKARIVAANDGISIHFTISRRSPLPMGICTPIECMLVPWAHLNPHPKQHLDWFSRFCRAHDCDRQTDRQTGRLLQTMSVCSRPGPHLRSTAMWPKSWAVKS